MDIKNKSSYLVCPDYSTQSVRRNIQDFCRAIEAKKLSPNKFFLRWYSNCILFTPVPDLLIKPLSHEYHIMQKGPETHWKMESKTVRRWVFDVTEWKGRQIAITFPGFYDLIVGSLPFDMPCIIEDKRIDTPEKGFVEPDCSLMHGFRFSQRELLTEFLSFGRSGLLGAPTRYGKTTLMVNTARAFPNSNIVVTAPGVDLVNQLYEDFTGSRGITGREIKKICSGSKTKYQSQEPNGITIVSVDSLTKCDPGLVDVLLADEPHALVTEGRLHKINMFHRARRFGYGATLKGRFDKADKLITGLFGPVLAERTYLEAVAEKAICPLHIIFLEIEITPQEFAERGDAYDALLFRNAEMANVIRSICEDVIPLEWQTLIFIDTEKQAELYLQHIGTEHTIAMAKRMNNKQREEVTELLRGDVIKRCLCTDIYVQGVTFPDVRVLINAAGGGNNTSAIQKPGRLAQVRPGKKCGIVIDFMFKAPSWAGTGNVQANPWRYLVIDSAHRKEAYEEKGYTIHTVKTIEELKNKFKEIS